MEGDPQNFRKERVVGKKKKKKGVSDKSKKIRHIFLIKKQNFCYIQLNISSTKNNFGLNKINCLKNNIVGSHFSD